jgi:hypothetical protein
MALLLSKVIYLSTEWEDIEPRSPNTLLLSIVSHCFLCNLENKRDGGGAT